VELTWTPSSSAGVLAYNVHYGTASGSYTSSILFSNVADVAIPGLNEGATYYFAVSAIDANGNESPLSSEAVYVVPVAGSLTLQARAAATGSRDVQLAWTASASGDVYGYAILYGTNHGNYTGE